MKMRVRKAIFPAAGLGTRFLPATKAQPKEMLPLVDKPIIQYGVEEALAAGCDQIIIVTGRGKSAIEDHFDISYELECTLEKRGKTDLLAVSRHVSRMGQLSCVRQKEAMGLGHAGPAGKPAPSNPRLFEVSGLVEKPNPADAPSKNAIIGRYILTPKIFDLLEHTPLGAGGELQLTDGIKGLLQTEKVYGYSFEGTRHDAGDKFGMLKATVEFALKREDLGPAFRDYLKTLKL